MSVEITIRHVKLSVALQSAARKKAEKLGADYPAVEFVRIVFDQEGPKYSVSLIIPKSDTETVKDIRRALLDLTQALLRLLMVHSRAPSVYRICRHTDHTVIPEDFRIVNVFSLMVFDLNYEEDQLP